MTRTERSEEYEKRQRQDETLWVVELRKDWNEIDLGRKRRTTR